MVSGAEPARWWCPGPDFPTGAIAPVAGDWGFSTQKPANGTIAPVGWHKSASAGRGHFGGSVALFLGLIGLPPGGALAGLEMVQLDRYRVGLFALSFPSPAGRIVGSESGVSGDGRLLYEDAGVAGQQVQDGAH